MDVGTPSRFSFFLRFSFRLVCKVLIFKKIDHPALSDPGRRSKPPDAS